MLNICPNLPDFSCRNFITLALSEALLGSTNEDDSGRLVSFGELWFVAIVALVRWITANLHIIYVYLYDYMHIFPLVKKRPLVIKNGKMGKLSKIQWRNFRQVMFDYQLGY